MRERNEAALLDTPELRDLQNLFDLSVDMFIVSTFERVLAVNPAYVSAMGYTTEELGNMSFLAVIHPDDLPQATSDLESVVHGGTSFLNEMRCVTKSGEVRWFQWCARADLENDRIYSSGRDVTNQHMDAERLRRYADLLERTQSELREAVDELTRVSNTDQLTGLFNRRGFEARLTEELSRAARSNSAVGIAMLDIDHFKQINDEHGHPMGDIVLREVARRMEASRRQYDVVARWGGEEFIALFPDSTLEEARAAAGRILLSVSARPIVASMVPISVRVSGGVTSCLGSEIDSSAAFIETADRALLLAKRNGRDRLEVIDMPGEVTAPPQRLGA